MTLKEKIRNRISAVMKFDCYPGLFVGGDGWARRSRKIDDLERVNIVLNRVRARVAVAVAAGRPRRRVMVVKEVREQL